MADFATEENKQSYNAITNPTSKTSDFTDIVIREMLKSGINPGGPYVSIKNLNRATTNPINTGVISLIWKVEHLTILRAVG